MSSTLGPLAIHHIIFFTEQDYRRRSNRLRYAVRLPQLALLARNVCPTWGHICELYFAGKRPPSLDELRLPALRLYLKDALDCEDVRFLFGHGKPMVFNNDFPPRLVSMVVQALVCLLEEPSALDITVNLPFTPPPAKGGLWSGFQCTPRGWIPIPREPMLKGLADVWPEAYAGHLPCAECTKVESLGEGNPRSTRYRLIEKFHISSKHFDTKLTVELNFAIGTPGKFEDADFPVRPTTARKIEKLELRQVRIYLDDETCGRCRLPGGTTRKSKTILLIPDFASDVYGFLHRVHIGTSLIANRGLSELIPKLKNRLPVHHLMCEFEGKKTKTGDSFTGDYKMIMHNFRRELSYSDVRLLKVPCAESPADNCALIRRYLSNSHVADLKVPYSDGRFSLKMLAALVVDHNCSLGRLRMGALDGPLTDYRSMDVLFGGRVKLNALNLSISSQDLVNLIKTTDFLRLPTVQGLTELKFLAVNPALVRQRRGKPPPRHRQAVVSAPLWIAGIHLLRNCALYQVDYDAPQSHLESIALKLVHICEKFERGEATEIRERFKFKALRHVNFPFKAGNQVSALQWIGCGGPRSGRRRLELYRFRNAATGQWLSACVGHKSCDDRSATSVMHITKGKASIKAMRSIEF